MRLLTFIWLPPCIRLIKRSAKQDQKLLDQGRGREQIAPTVSTEMPAQCRARVSFLVIVSLKSPRSECELLYLSNQTSMFPPSSRVAHKILTGFKNMLQFTM